MTTKAQSIEAEAKHLANGSVKVNNWSSPGVAAFDFRSAYDVHPVSSSRLPP